ncbi:MAG: glycosyltransferase [Muribaculaceae bacterium]|nr:glycosyltransferase [Muribaculaceae bacterium]
MNRLYESIVKVSKATRSEINFEWIVVDDGSSDNTRSLVEKFCAENLFPIKYYYQENQGKHVAMNFASDVAEGEMFLTIDSDDELLPECLNIFFDTWTTLDEKLQKELKGITGRCIDPNTGKIIGSPLPKSINGGQYLITSPQDLRHKYKVRGEMMGFNRTDIMKKFKHNVKPDVGKFMPEGILWSTIGLKYKEYVINVPVRVYNSDGNNAITSDDSKKRAPQNYYLWQFEVNNLVKKYHYCPLKMDGVKN